MPMNSVKRVGEEHNAQAFYERMFNQCKPREAIERYVGDAYIQHNPEVADQAMDRLL
jgi:predicted SnoaL-like aldol condensation-catalyzing enzyme